MGGGVFGDDLMDFIYGLSVGSNRSSFSSAGHVCVNEAWFLGLSAEGYTDNGSIPHIVSQYFQYLHFLWQKQKHHELCEMA